MSQHEEHVLVCALASQPDCVIKGSIAGHHCSQCKAELMVSPSGQWAMQQRPEMALLCGPCAMTLLSEFDEVEAVPGALEELAEDAIARRARHARN